ncbi:amino acid ABC transporter permease [Rhizobium sp. AG207R]|uniref:amino acid ABC transporter permease n=1 Tax=Rhizobium sp. AG207R TaxID=2802287 RepID=UPI0022AC5A85|nr:amino acid ABC transporter permease [Rhizobium sp. AG207R]MCZ3378408.1 amino acid ABC transporter permease [Rhizobium sp. AG207R]
MAIVDRAQPAVPKPVSFIYDPRLRGLVYQVLVVGLVFGGAWYLASNALENLARQSITTGFGFLTHRASFDITQHLISYSAASDYLRALEVGFLNTMLVAILGIVLATVLGTTVGMLRLTKNWMVGRIAAAYVELARNLPLLLQLFFWYGFVTISLPGPREALRPLPGVILSNRGLMLPVPQSAPIWVWVAVALLVALGLAIGFRIWARRRQDRTGRPLPSGLVAAITIVALPTLTWLLGGAPTEMDTPKLAGFAFDGGVTLSPEFVTILFGLVIYTAAFIAEVVRAGILAVNWGQSEAALALGLKRGQILRLVVVPQAFRVIVPQLTSEFLNLTKNSSLAVAVGYPDLVSITNTTINQTGQAIEGISIIMIVYLTISLLISGFMNWFNARVALTER